MIIGIHPAPTQSAVTKKTRPFVLTGATQRRAAELAEKQCLHKDLRRHTVQMYYCQSCDKPIVMVPRDGRTFCPQCGCVGDSVALGPLFVVTGASGAGKTAVAGLLARKLQGRCVTFDADFLMDGAAPLSDSRWLAIAHSIAQSGLPTVLLGPFIPEHLDELDSRRWVSDIHVIVLDCPDELRRARINARPPWRSRDIDEQIKFGRWLRNNISDRVDTGSGSPERTAGAIAAWIDRHLAHDDHGQPRKALDE